MPMVFIEWHYLTEKNLVKFNCLVKRTQVQSIKLIEVITFENTLMTFMIHESMITKY